MKLYVEKNTDLNNLFKSLFFKKWDLSKTEEKEISKLNSELERYVNKYGKRIVKEIQNITGFKWHENEIKIYIVLEKFMPGQSISYPLIIKSKRNFDLIIAVTLHEVIHHNLNCKEFFRLTKGKVYEKEGAAECGIEDIVNTVLFELLRRIHKKKAEMIIKKFKKYLIRTYKSSWRGVDILEKKWSFSKHSLSKFLE